MSINGIALLYKRQRVVEYLSYKDLCFFPLTPQLVTIALKLDMFLLRG